MSVFVFTVSAAAARAQQEDSVIVAPGSGEIVFDSIPEQPSYPDSAYDADESYADEENETLYFIGKEDTLSLYDSSLIEWRAVPDTTVQALKSDKDFWYVNKNWKQKKEKEADDKDNSGQGNFLSELLGSKAVRQAIFIFIVLLFVVAIIWFLVKNKMNLFGRGKTSLAPELQATEGEPENIFTADLQSAIEKAEKNEEYRLAVRLSYLLLLKKFSEEGWIKYREDTTNMEYLGQLYSRPFYREFFTVMRNYEYAWYGEMPVSSSVYNRVRQDITILYAKASLSN
ncbi:MAG: hypothetical protein KF862_06560 [Chitinophagaceae bacterium]|nr:hypothetical protein [Chitinophagaceae bacterium]